MPTLFLQIQPSTIGNEKADDLGITALTGEHERCLSVVCHCIQSHTGINEEAHYLVVTVFTGYVEKCLRSYTPIIVGRNVCLQEEADEFRITFANGIVEVALIQYCTSSQEDADDIEITIHTG